MDEDERKAIRDVLMTMLLDGEEWLEQRPAAPNAGGAVPFNALTSWQLDSYLLHGPSGEFKPGEGIRVRPPRREAHMAALWCKWRFKGALKGCWFYVGIWLGNGQFIAFRFEPPEQGDNHNYYHSQPCRTMGWEGEPTYDAVPVPTRNPTWPLPARSALDLLLCLVVSIHGMDGLRKLKERIEERSKANQNKVLAKALADMMEAASTS